MSDTRSRSHRDQLKDLLPALLKSKTPNNAGAWKTDGEDHINISRHGKTRLGSLLDFDHIRNFNHPILGNFKSLNSLWYFLRAREPHDHLRQLSGWELKEFAFKACNGLRGSVPNFRAIIMHSAYLNIKAHRECLDTIVKSTLPFDCYKTLASGIRERFEHSLWVNGGYEEIRFALKEKREPDFSYLADRAGDDIYAGVIRMLSPTGAAEANAPVEAKPDAPKPTIEPTPERTKKRRNRHKKRTGSTDTVAQTESTVVEPTMASVGAVIQNIDGDPIPVAAHTPVDLPPAVDEQPADIVENQPDVVLDGPISQEVDLDVGAVDEGVAEDTLVDALVDTVVNTLVDTRVDTLVQVSDHQVYIPPAVEEDVQSVMVVDEVHVFSPPQDEIVEVLSMADELVEPAVVVDELVEDETTLMDEATEEATTELLSGIDYSELHRRMVDAGYRKVLIFEGDFKSIYGTIDSLPDVGTESKSVLHGHMLVQRGDTLLEEAAIGLVNEAGTVTSAYIKVNADVFVEA